MLHVYGLSYAMPQYVLPSVASIVDHAGEPIHLTVIDNKSDRSAEIRTGLYELWKHGVVQRVVSLANNVRGAAYLDVMDLYPSSGDDFVVWTDLDLLVPSATRARGGWVPMLRTAMRGADVAAFRLSLDNYVPPNAGHLDSAAQCGVWLMGLRRDFLATLERGMVHVDARLCDRARAGRGFTRVSAFACQLVHLGWNLWRDDPAYFAKKVAGIDWARYEAPVIEAVLE